MSGWLGGYASQDDRAQLTVRFLARDSSELGSALIGPVHALDRGNETGLLYRESTGPVPQGTRQARVTLDAIWATGSNDGYADDLGLVISERE